MDNTPLHILLDEGKLTKISREELKNELRMRGQWLSGNKKELFDRLN